MHLDRGRQTESELDEAMIQQGRAQLYRGSHRHPVGALQQVVGEHVPQVVAQHPVNGVDPERR